MNIADTIKILKRLRMVQVEYPTHFLESRRADFFAQVAEIRADMKANQPNAQSNTSLSGNSAGMVEKVLQYISIGTFVTASALGVYTFREEIRDFFAPETADIQTIDGVTNESPVPLPSDEPTVIMTPTPTFTETPFNFTSTPHLRDNDPVVENTPAPTETKPGLRIGHTKTPKPDGGG